MRPANTNERRQTFRTFLFFFIITVAVIIGCVFFSIQVPFAENNQLRDQISVIDRQRILDENFLNTMDRTSKLLDSVNRPDVSAPELIDGNIEAYLKNMQNMINNDSSAVTKSLYTNIITNLYELKKAKKQLREASGKDATFGNLQKENDDLHAKLQDANATSQSYLMLLQNCQNRSNK